jgi:hypothetical protein
MLDRSALLLCLLGSAACRDPTLIELALTTEVSCADGSGVAIMAGEVGLVEDAPPVTVAPCIGADLGTLVFVPSAEADAPIAFKLVASLEADTLDACIADNAGPTCITARRALRYLPNEALRVPVRVDPDCAGIPCGATETCVDGTCRPAAVNPETCRGAGCDEGALPPAPLLAPAYARHSVYPGVTLRESLVALPNGDIVFGGEYTGAIAALELPSVGLAPTQIFAVGLDAAHQRRWGVYTEEAVSMGMPTAGGAHGGELAHGADGSVYLAGWASSIELAGIAPMSNDTLGGLVARLDPSGQVEWVKRVQSEVVALMDVAADAESVRVGGAYQGPPPLPGAPPADTPDMLVAAFDEDGVEIAAAGWGGNLSEQVIAIAAYEGDTFVSADLAGMVTIGDELLAGPSAVAIRLDRALAPRWIAQLSGDTGATDISVGAGGSSCFVGSFTGTVSAGGVEIASDGGLSGYVWALDDVGGTRWLRRVAGQESAVIYRVATSADGDIVIAGSANGPPYGGDRRAAGRARLHRQLDGRGPAALVQGARGRWRAAPRPGAHAGRSGGGWLIHRRARPRRHGARPDRERRAQRVPALARARGSALRGIVVRHGAGQDSMRACRRPSRFTALETTTAGGRCAGSRASSGSTSRRRAWSTARTGRHPTAS